MRPVIYQSAGLMAGRFRRQPWDARLRAPTEGGEAAYTCIKDTFQIEIIPFSMANLARQFGQIR